MLPEELIQVMAGVVVEAPTVTMAVFKRVAAVGPAAIPVRGA
jgi:hypothetical protein